MARSLTTQQKIAIRADHVIQCYLVQIDLDSGTLRFALAGHDVLSGGNTWKGTGNLASIEPISEGVELQARGVRMMLSGISPALVSAALSEPLANRAVNIFIVIYDSDTHAAIDSAWLEWSGVLDTMQVVTEPRK